MVPPNLHPGLRQPQCGEGLQRGAGGSGVRGDRVGSPPLGRGWRQTGHSGERRLPRVGHDLGLWLCNVTLPRSAGSRGLPYCCIITTLCAHAQMMISFSFYGWFTCWQAMPLACTAALAFRGPCFLEWSQEPGMPGSEPHTA